MVLSHFNPAGHSETRKEQDTSIVTTDLLTSKLLMLLLLGGEKKNELHVAMFFNGTMIYVIMYTLQTVQAQMFKLQ